MCGIIWVKRKDEKDARKNVLKRYLAQKSRGTKGYGFVTINDGVIGDWWQAQEEDQMRLGMEKIMSNDILFHHRTPTSTPNVFEATHPILVFNDKLKYNYYVVHNGIISNADTVKEKYEKEGYIFTTKVKTVEKTEYITATRTYPSKEKINEEYNDSESFAIDIANVIENGKDEIDCMGSIAFMALQVEKGTGKVLKMYFGRNYRNPLKLDNGKDLLTITSEGRGIDVDPNRLWSYDYATAEITNERMVWLGFKSDVPAKGTSSTSTEQTSGWAGFRTAAEREKEERRSEYAKYGIDYDDFDDVEYSEWWKKVHGKPNQLKLTAAEDATCEIENSTPADAPFEAEVIENAVGFTVWDSYGLSSDFRNLEEFQDYYCQVIEEIAELEDNLEIYKYQKDYTGQSYCTESLKTLRLELETYNHVIDQIKNLDSTSKSETIII